MNQFKKLTLIGCFLLLGISMSFSQQAGPKFDVISNVVGTVEYESQLPRTYMHFYLFGDGYYDKAHNPIHTFDTNNKGWGTELYYIDDKVVDDPDEYTGPTGETNNNAYVPPVVHMRPTIELDKSWNITAIAKTFVIFKFQNDFGGSPDGCIEFHFDERNLEVYPDDTKIYNTWVEDDYVLGPNKVTYNYKGFLEGDQRIIYIPVRAIGEIGQKINYHGVIKDGCTGKGISHKVKENIKGVPHDPNTVELKKPRHKLSHSAALYERYEVTEQVLTYKFEFHNIGDAPAQNVVVEELFEASVDINSIQVQGSSAAVEVSGSTFTFNNIYLPGAAEIGVDFETTFAHCVFTVCMLDYIEPDQCVGNGVDIYFDTLAPVNAHTIDCAPSLIDTYKQFGNPCNTIGIGDYKAKPGIGIGAAIFEGDQVFPNPATTELTLKFNSIISSNIQVIDIQGKHLFSKFVGEQQKVNLDISNLQPGMYFVKYDKLGETITKRFVKI